VVENVRCLIVSDKIIEYRPTYEKATLKTTIHLHPLKVTTSQA